MDDKKIAAIDKIYRLTLQDAEFNEELRKKLDIASSCNSLYVDDEKISQIYEYCIEKIIRKQAEEFYKDFPLKSIVPSLVEDFARMESFKRKDNFGDFCLSLYQQIECISNKLCETKILSGIAEKMWAYPAYVKSDKNTEARIDNRTDSDYSIASLVFPGIDKNSGQPYSYVKSRSNIQTLYANDKIRTIVYFLGYKATMKSGDYDSYKEITSLLYDIYQCRNMNHRGNTLTEWEKEVQNRIIPMKYFYYFKFIGILAQYVQYVKEGFPYLKKVEEYAETLQPKKVPMSGLKTVGFIDVSKEKRRFK